MRILLSLIVFALLAAASLAVTIQTADQKKVTIYNQIGLEDVDRTVDVSKPNVVRETIKISAFNSGDQAQTAIYLAYPKKLVENNLALLEVVLPNKEKLELTNQGFENKLQKDAVFFEVKLNKALNSNDKVSITVNSAFINTVAAFPKQIKQRENQKVLYADNVYLYSPYAVSSQKTTYQIGTTSIESYTDTVKPVDRRGTSIVYGSFSNQKPFAEQQVKLHYQSNAPFVVISQLERIIEISHWGNLAVEEHYDLRHAGAALKGSFSRLDYQRNPAQSSPASFRSIVAKLPIDAADIYYRDRIGNISTSDCKPSGDKKNLEVEILPRYPMFGGWKVKFYIGYNLPLSNYASVDGEHHTLSTKFGTPFDAPIEDLTVKVIVPEGAENIKVNLPFSIDSESRETLKTYLDTFGRTVVVLKKRNVVEDHNQVFTVTYNFSATSAFQEPGLVITALFAFCIIVMVYVRLDLSISKTETQSKAENEARVYEVIEVFSDKHLARDNLYKSFERAIRRGNAEELKSLKATRTAIKASIRDKILQELNQLEARDFSTKVGVVEKKDDEKFQLLETLSEIVTDKKLTGAKLEARVKEIEKEYDQKTEEINDIFDGFDL